MKHYIKKINLSLAIAASLLILSFAFVSLPTFADSGSNANAVCNGVNVTGGGGCGAGDKGASDSINSVIKTVVNILSWVVGIAAVIMVIIGGLLYVISSGDATKAAKARNTIIYALVGLVVVALAQVIVRFVIGKV